MQVDINGAVCGAVELEYPRQLAVRFDPTQEDDQWSQCVLYVRDALWRISGPEAERFEQFDPNALAHAKQLLVGRTVVGMHHEEKFDRLVIGFAGQRSLEIEGVDQSGDGRYIGRQPGVSPPNLPTWPYSFVLRAR